MNYDGNALAFLANEMHLQLSAHLTPMPHSGAFLKNSANFLARANNLAPSPSIVKVSRRI
jgi:hypothetical protein